MASMGTAAGHLRIWLGWAAMQVAIRRTRSHEFFDHTGYSAGNNSAISIRGGEPWLMNYCWQIYLDNVILINGVSFLETELGNRKTNHFMLVYFHAPLSQEIKRRHRPRDASPKVSPYTMAHFLAMEDRRE